jgi:thymidylate synthase
MERQYLAVLQDALAGNPRACRNGATRAIFAVQLRHDLRTGFPLLTSKRMAWKTIVGELLWFLEAGRDSPVPYRLSNVRLRELLGLPPSARTIWTHDSEKRAWLARARFPGDCGRIYGAQWRNWAGEVDQLAKLVSGLREDPASRYHKVVAWNPGELAEMCLPPCHGDFQCFVTLDEATGEKLLSLHMMQRSCDLFLGVPFNIASYALLLLMLAQVTGMIAHELVLTLNDAHVYEAHVPAVETQLARRIHPPPRVRLDPAVRDLDGFRPEHFSLEGYACEEPIAAPLL